MSRKTNILLGIGYIVGLSTFFLLTLLFQAKTPVASAATIQQAVSADLRMGADGRPMLFETMGGSEGIYVTYLDKDGNINAKAITIGWDSKMYQKAAMVIGHAECKEGKQ